MSTGVHRISPSALIDRELACQGSSLMAWCDESGVPPATAREVIDGNLENEEVLALLAATLGVSVTSLRIAG